MYSYPNLIPLPASKVKQIISAVQPFEFDRLYGAWDRRVVLKNAKEIVKRSGERYIKAIKSE
jgi:hypothetical protein